MDFDFLDQQLLESSKQAVQSFKSVVEGARPTDKELDDLCDRIQAYPHTISLDEDFVITAVDGSGEFPVLQQDDIFIHFITASAATYKTASSKQHKLSSVHGVPPMYKQFVVLSDDNDVLRSGYQNLLKDFLGFELDEIVQNSDYCKVFSQFGKKLKPENVTWEKLAMSKASEIASHAYLLRTTAELGMAIKALSQSSRYLLIDTSLVYFMLGQTPFLPEILKRYLISKANKQGTGIVALCKSHNIPNGDLVSQHAKDKLRLNDHWYLRLPSESLGEPIPKFLKGKEIPPKLSVSYLFKFEATQFPMRIDVDADWWKVHIGGNYHKEQQFFSDLDFTCHEVRSYGYPYPMHAAHRSASLTKQERRALRDILLQNAMQEGVVRSGSLFDPEQLHMSGM